MPYAALQPTSKPGRPRFGLLLGAADCSSLPGWGVLHEAGKMAVGFGGMGGEPVKQQQFDPIGKVALIEAAIADLALQAAQVGNEVLVFMGVAVGKWIGLFAHHGFFEGEECSAMPVQECKQIVEVDRLVLPHFYGVLIDPLQQFLMGAIDALDAGFELVFPQQRRIQFAGAEVMLRGLIFTAALKINASRNIFRADFGTACETGQRQGDVFQVVVGDSLFKIFAGVGFQLADMGGVVIEHLVDGEWLRFPFDANAV